jgi:hypothetical protein
MDRYARFERGVAIVGGVAQQLNAIAREQAIPIDNKEIWQVIHNLTDEEWQDIFDVLKNLDQEGAFTESDQRVIEDAKEKFDKAYMLGKEWVGKPYVKHRGHKNEVWQVWMRIREIVNRYNGIYIPNGPQSTIPPKKTANTFQEIFQ